MPQHHADLTPVDAPSADRDCAEHGVYTAHMLRDFRGVNVYSRCPQCMASEQAQADAEHARKAAQRMASRLASSGLQGRYLRSRFETSSGDAKQRAALDACQQFAQRALQGAAGSLFLIGPPGTGKTYAAACMVRLVIEAAVDQVPEWDSDRDGRVIDRAEVRSMAYLLTASELIRQIRATWRDKVGATEEEIVERYGRAALLALDDVGATAGTDSEARHLLDVIDLRYRLELPTVIASNLPLPELRASLGERAYDRLRERSAKVVFNWPSLRCHA